MARTQRTRPDYSEITNTLITKILPSIQNASDDLEDMLLDNEFTAQIMRNLTGIKLELARAEKSAVAAAAVAEHEAQGEN